MSNFFSSRIVGLRQRRSPRYRVVLFAASVVFAPNWTNYALAIGRNEATRLAREYLATEDRAERRKLSKELANYDADIEPVLAKLSKRSYESVKTGYRPEKHFLNADLRKKHPDDLLYFTVPRSYRPDVPTGLIVFMHGGGATTTRRAPR